MTIGQLTSAFHCELVASKLRPAVAVLQLGSEWTSNLLYSLVPWLSDMSGQRPPVAAQFWSGAFPWITWAPPLSVPRVHNGFQQMYSQMAKEQDSSGRAAGGQAGRRAAPLQRAASSQADVLPAQQPASATVGQTGSQAAEPADSSQALLNSAQVGRQDESLGLADPLMIAY